MIIWRGWGILALAFAGIGVAIGSSLGSTGHRTVPTGIALMLAGVGTWFFGQWVNEQRPEEQFKHWHQGRWGELMNLAHAGQLAHLDPAAAAGQPPLPPQQLAETVLASETQHVRSLMFNRHTLFFIPMQFIGILMAAGGLIVAASGFFAR